MEKLDLPLALIQSVLFTERFTCMLCYSIENISQIVPAELITAKSSIFREIKKKGKITFSRASAFSIKKEIIGAIVYLVSKLLLAE